MNLIINILTTLSTRLGVTVLALISSILLARLLGPEGRGLLALVQLLPELILTFGLLGFDQAYAVYAGLEPERRQTLLWQSVIISIVVGGIASISSSCFVIFGAPGFESLIHGPLWLYILPLVIIPVRMIITYWQAILRGMNKIFLINAIELGSKTFSVLFIILIVGLLELNVARVVSIDIAISLSTVIFLLFIFRSMNFCWKPSFDWVLWRKVGRFSLPVYFGTIMSYFNYRIDQLFVAIMLPPAKLAFYVLAVSLAEQLWILTGAVNTALLPHLTNSKTRDPVICAIVARHVMVWTGIACCLLFLLAKVLVRLLYSNDFIETVAPLYWLLPGIFTLSIGKVLVSELLIREKAQVTMWIAIIAAFINISGNLLLIPYMGISGAALASTISYTLVSILVIWLFVRETGVPASMLIPQRDDLLAYSFIWRRFTR